MGYRPYDPHQPRLVGYDPVLELAPDHLARFVAQVVEQTVVVKERPVGPGQPPYNPRLCISVLVYGYATGVRSSRQLQQNCEENLAYRYLVGDDVPSYHTLCTARRQCKEQLEAVWVGLFGVAEATGMERIGKIVVDTTKLRANASGESVLKAEQFAPVLAELERILAEAETVDAREAQEGHPGRTRLGKVPEKEQMRDILRRVRAQVAKEKRAAGKGAQAAAGEQEAASGNTGEAAGAATGEGAAEEEGPGEEGKVLTERMRQRVQEVAEALREAMAQGRKFMSTTDPQAEMMAGGSDHRIRECHSLEGAVDKGSGLLVAAGTTQETSDNARLEPLVAQAQQQEPVPITEVDGDSGFFDSMPIVRLEEAGIDTCIPDSSTACDLHRGQPVGTSQGRNGGEVPLEYDAEGDCFRCSQGMVLVFTKTETRDGQEVRVYQAEGDCACCPLAGKCLHNKKAKRRMVRVCEHGEQVKEILQRFDEASRRERYGQRGSLIETVWGFLRGTLGYDRWLLRGKEGVAAEGRLLRLAYQVRKVHGNRAAAAATA